MELAGAVMVTAKQPVNSQLIGLRLFARTIYQRMRQGYGMNRDQKA